MPSAEYGTFGVKDFDKSMLSPINAYSCGNTLTYEWDMVDNFSAGDKVLDEDYTKENTADNAYRAMRAVQYCDMYGKATLCDIELYGDLQLSFAEIRALPEAPTTDPSNAVVKTDNSIVLLKDCREVIHFNYNLMQVTDSDTFVLSPFFFSDSKKNEAKIVILSEEVNKMSNGYISPNSILAENSTPTITANNGIITVDMSWIGNVPYELLFKAKSIVIMEKEQTAGTMQKFILAKNGSITDANWYFGAPNKDAIWNRENGNRQ